jgi:hemerythrin superfamily protein
MTRNAPPGDALALLQRRHRQLEALFDEVFDAEDAEQRGWQVQKACDELAGLLAAEEQVLYPRLWSDDPAVRRGLADHESLRALAAELLTLAPVDDEVEAHCRALADALQAHHRFEEDEVFRHAAEQIPVLERQALGTAVAVCLVQQYAAGAPRRALQLRHAPRPPMVAAGSAGIAG